MAEPTYGETRAELEQALRALARIGDGQPGARVAEGARSLLKKLAEELFNVVVVGEFKRGKTTLVNAVLGADVLPSAVVPLTSIVTAVTWGERPRAEVSFLDGRTESVAVEDLPRYVTERGNARNGLGVDRAVLYYPADELRDGVFLVDTPGVGSVYRHNTEAAYAFVPECDAAVFLTSADPPISDGERAFLEDVRAEAARMFFVLNKVDYLSERDREEALAFTREVAKDAVGTEPNLYPVSARQGLVAKMAGDHDGFEASGLAAFERDFRRFLMREKGAVVLASVSAQARKLVADAHNALDVEERALRIPIEDLAARSEQMERIFARAIESREGIRMVLRIEVEKLVTLVEQDLANLRREAGADILRRAEAFVDESTDVRTAAAGLDPFVEDALRRWLDRWRAEEDRRIGRAFHRAMARHVDETNRLIEGTVRLCGELLEVALSSVDVPGELAPETRFTYSFFDAPTILESLLPDAARFMPSSVARRRLLKEIRESIPGVVAKHCGRLRWDFVQRLEGSRLALERALGGRLDATIESLRLGVRRVLHERSRSEVDARSTEPALEADRRALEALEAAFALIQEPAAEQGNQDDG
jgi:hypothetical protein